MKVTHLGHATVLVETLGARILLDPGSFGDSWHTLTDLDAVLVTHQHVDHVDPVHVAGLLERNGTARFLVEPGVVALLGSSVPAEPLAAGEHTRVGDVEVSGVGGTHALVHPEIPRVGNVGMVLRSDGEPTFFHPGDSFETVPEGVDVVALPTFGPWGTLGQAIDFARAVAAPRGFPIHDGMLSDRGRSLFLARIADMTGTVATDLKGSLSAEF